MPKRRKNTLKTQGSYIDRISDLPDSILAHILGKLPTKYAVCATILSKRWKHLFTQIPEPEISIDDNELMYIHEEKWTVSISRRKANLIKFMYDLLNVTLRDVPRIKKFHLRLDDDYEYDEIWKEERFLMKDHISEWVSAVLRLNVSYLWVFCPVVSYGGTPDSVFCCTSLVDLMLNWKVGMVVPNSVCLPNLKCIYLKNVLFHGDALATILSGCNVLEELCLCRCQFNDIAHVVRIFSPSVKSFKMENCQNGNKYGIELDMPALNFLCYDDCVPKYFLVKNLRSVRKAHINYRPGYLEEYRGDRLPYFESVTDLFVGCSNAEFLSLTQSSVMAISCCFLSLRIFCNLNELELHCIDASGWMLLPHLLKNAPNLEVLVFKKGFTGHKGCYKIFKSHMLGQMTNQVDLNLQRIKFEKIDGEVDVIRLISFFLTNAKVLKKIEISFSCLLSHDKLLKARSKVLNLQKKSKNCHIDLISGAEEYDGDRSFGMRKFE